MFPISRLLLYVTRDCNLNCTYCFVDKKSGYHLPWETGMRAVDWLVHEVSGSEKKLWLGFFGGEPLVVSDLVSKLVEYSHDEASLAGKEINYSMTTNALFINEELLAFFSKYPFHMTVSIDGRKEVHDLFRRKSGRVGYFEELMDKVPLILKLLPDTGARITVNPETASHLGESVEFIQSLGFKAISIGFNADVPWSDEDFRVLDKGLRKAANSYLDWIMNERPVHISSFNNALNNLISGTRPHAVCGAGKGYAAVGLNGDIYPCQHFVCMDNFEGGCRLGNIESGIDINLRLPFLRYDAEKSLGCYTSCEECKANAICGGGCLADGYMRNGLFQMPDPIEQKFNVILAEIAGQIHQFLDKQQPPFYVNLCKELGQKYTCRDDV